MPRINAKLMLPVVGVLLFARISYHYLNPATAVTEGQGRYVYWSCLRLDADPLNRHPKVVTNPCRERDANCAGWDLQAVWVDPGYFDAALVESALPAFLVGGVLVKAFGHCGVSQVTTFLVCMPPLIVAWYYFLVMAGTEIVAANWSPVLPR